MLKRAGTFFLARPAIPPMVGLVYVDRHTITDMKKVGIFGVPRSWIILKIVEDLHKHNISFMQKKEFPNKCPSL